MNDRLDRHARGMRGPLALPNAYGPAARLSRRRSREAIFTQAVTVSLARIRLHAPEALAGVQVGVEDVPFLATAWSGNHVPLAAAVEASAAQPARIVVYRRPLEHRAATNRGLKILVHRTIVEQLAALTGLSVETLDPEDFGGDEPW